MATHLVVRSASATLDFRSPQKKRSGGVNRSVSEQHFKRVNVSVRVIISEKVGISLVALFLPPRTRARACGVLY